MKIISYSLVLVFVFLFACSEKEDDFSITEGKAFFPLEVGKYRLYKVDSVVYDPIASGIFRDSSSTFIREEITEIFQDLQGNDVYRVERQGRQRLDDPWAFQLAYTMENNSEYAIQNENNLRLKVFPFSISDNKNWVATNLFDETVILMIAGEGIQVYKDLASSFQNINQTESIGNFELETITIIHKNQESNPFERRFIKEKYAKGVGLVYREMQIFDSDYCNQEPVPGDCNTIAWEEKAEKGFSIKQTILEFN